MTSLSPDQLAFPDEPAVLCKHCSETKPLSDYYIDKRYCTPKQPCKGCYHAKFGRRQQQIRRAADPEKQKERDRRWRLNNPEKAAAKDRRQREKLRATGLLPQIDRAKNLWRLYKITPEDFEELVEAQGGLCACCGKPPNDGEPLHVDHDHSCCPGSKSCGKCIRGLVHNNCNRALGLIGDDPDRLLQAAQYLIDYANKTKKV